VPRSPGEMLRVFSALAMQGFGGVLPVAQRELVERRQWLTREQFLEALSIGQVLPGPNIVNMALIIGDRFFGWRGAVAALVGLLALPLLIVLALAAMYARFATEPIVAGALRGMGAVAAGLILAMACKLLPTLARNPLGRPLSALALLATVTTVGVLRWPMAYAVIAIGGAAVFAAWWRLGPKP
jgi:chromate transporter